MRLRSTQLLLEILATHHHAEKIPNVLYWMEEQSVNVWVTMLETLSARVNPSACSARTVHMTRFASTWSVKILVRTNVERMLNVGLNIIMFFALVQTDTLETHLNIAHLNVSDIYNKMIIHSFLFSINMYSIVYQVIPHHNSFLLPNSCSKTWNYPTTRKLLSKSLWTIFNLWGDWSSSSMPLQTGILWKTTPMSTRVYFERRMCLKSCMYQRKVFWPMCWSMRNGGFVSCQ